VVKPDNRLGWHLVNSFDIIRFDIEIKDSKGVPMNNLVVIFQATRQETESLALAFGLGAVQAGADIRLRHLDPSPATSLAHAGYGTLRVEDLRWAQRIAIFLESNAPAALGDLRSALDVIAKDPDNGSKIIWLFHPDRRAESILLLESIANQIGFRHVAVLDGMPAAGEITRMAQRLIGDDAEEF